MAFEARRTKVILDDLPKRLETTEHTEMPKHNGSWLGKKSTIWKKETIQMLSLTRWQLRALVSPDAFHILTGWQAYAFFQKFCSNKDLVNLLHYKPMGVLNRYSVKEYKSLYKLFGEVDKPLGLATIEPLVLI